MNKKEYIFASIAIVMPILLIFIIGELFFRAALFSDNYNIEKLQMASRYADGLYDEDYWKLAYLFKNAKNATKAGRIDEKLGWALEKSPENPLGIVTDKKYSLKDIHKPVLFYGDSFTAGITPINTRIPQVMDQQLPDLTVINYGVSGFGIDQIYLRFLNSFDQFDSPIVLLGMLTYDLDRSILKFRSSVKPYFEINGNSMTLKNTPVTMSAEEYVEANPPEIKSYFVRFILMRLRHIFHIKYIDSILGYDLIHEKKLVVNHHILKSISKVAKDNNLKVYAVLFYSGEEILAPTWRGSFLMQELNNNGIDVFDTRSYLLSFSKETGISAQDLYFPDEGHPNIKGNKVIADGIIKWLTDIGALTD